ncbi:2-nitropropane dioxygenase [Desulfosarcina alkanivorans]|uniref:2-nitropropane dioxygenase n=1 Tax=Desulfosarcina alkanivorans TaxID=571177 RepID=A0A5K7YG57_9BACT|nr:nitronate monooxygenase [Desulfosarcina alkanivorans]BBO68048.1 2-nitropropane dioxygenase [Desulfosarcina alkanivorans]
MKSNRLSKLIGIDYPLFLGPMRLITLGEMAAAVSNSGGFGQIAASGLSPDRLREEIDKAHRRTDRPFGVNIPIYRKNAIDQLEVCTQCGIRTITTSAGNPTRIIELLRNSGVKVLHKVSSVEMALKAESAGVDAVIATGHEAGGHVGRDGATTFCLVPMLVDALQIPVIAAGGIADARGLVAAFAFGAEGVEVGTRFVATDKAPVPDFFKELLIMARSQSTTLLGKNAMPIRVLKNKAAVSILNPVKSEEDRQIQGDAADRQYIQSGGDADSAIMPAGQIAGLIQNVKDIGAVFPEMIEAAHTISERVFKNFQRER